MKYTLQFAILAVMLGLIIAMCFIYVPDRTTPSLVHPTVNGLRLRLGKPASLEDQNVIRTLRREETLRVLSSEIGIYGRWLEIENVATGERGWIADWYTEAAALADEVPERSLAYVLYEHTTDKVKLVAAWFWTAKTSAVVTRVSELCSIVGLLIAVVKLRKRRIRPEPVLVSATAPLRPPQRKTADFVATQSSFYGTAAGKPWSIRRLSVQ